MNTTTDTTPAPAAPATRAAAPTKKVTHKPAPRKKAAPAPKRAPAGTKKKAAKPVKTATKPQATASKKPKLVRDSYTMPKDEYAMLGALKERSAKLGHAAKKSELLRAGLQALKGLNDKALLAALQGIPSLKTGRPKKKA